MAMSITAVVFKLSWIGIGYIETLLIADSLKRVYHVMKLFNCGLQSCCF